MMVLANAEVDDEIISCHSDEYFRIIIAQLYATPTSIRIRFSNDWLDVRTNK